jgi:leucyl/phenylalanyl-tRNA---protein transferase
MVTDRTKKIIRLALSRVMQMQKHTLPDRILAAYRKGKFPMAGRLGILQWHSPEKRTIIPLDERFHVERELRRIVRKKLFEITFNQAFCDVIQACAEVTPERSEAWLSPELVEAHTQLHKDGFAHSIEVWQDGGLVGGLYGIAIGGFFSGESMFHRADNASKVGMVYLVNRLRERGYRLHDAQFLSPVSRNFGGHEIDRREYLKLLHDALSHDVTFEPQPLHPLDK